MAAATPELPFSVGEVEDLIVSISDAEYKRIILLIEQLNPDQSGNTAEDIYELVLQKILSGERKWPRHVKAPTFIRNAARSVIWNEIKKKKDGLSHANSVHDVDSLRDTDLTTDLQNDNQAISEAVHSIMDLFSEDQEIRCIILNKIKSLSAIDIKKLCKLTENAYQAAIRRMKRNARKKYPMGIDYWRQN